MRLTDFWERMAVAFGPHAESLVQMHVLSELGNRTPDQALQAGESPVTVWRAICEAFELPVARR